MSQRRRAAGLTILELLASLLVVATALVVAVPSIAGAKGNSGVQQSMSNMAGLGVAHVIYALDWDLRQVTWVRDDLGAYGGNPWTYNSYMGGCSGFPYPEECQPGVVAGWDCDGFGPWGYWPNFQFHAVYFQPIAFPGFVQPAGYGTFRVPNARPLHDYLNGRYQDPAYYAPNDTAVMAEVAACLNTPCEFNSHCNPAWSSYVMSPAAMFHHDVMRSNAAGGWQAPWTLPQAYQGPGLFQAAYPDLKTLMIEHNWVQGPPAACNPAEPESCEPFYFNHGIGSTPVALFYDISVRLLSNTEAFDADQQVLKQTGGVDGLWHRGTSFGADGYFISEGFDGTPLSHHILTTDGILGRDTLGGAVPLSLSAKYALPGLPAPQAPAKSAVPVAARPSILFSPPAEEDP